MSMANSTNWTLEDGIGLDGVLRHVVPAPMAMRIFFVACGAFILVVTTAELGRGFWPITLLGLPFLFILLGAFSIGVPMILVGLLAPAARWTVAPQGIDIALNNPFRGWRVSFTPGAVAAFDIAENEGDGGPSTFRVVLRTVEGKRYDSRVFQSREAAERLRRDIERIFYGHVA